MSLPKDLQELLGDAQARCVQTVPLQQGAPAAGFVRADKPELGAFVLAYSSGVQPMDCAIKEGPFNVWEPHGWPGFLVVESTQAVAILRGQLEQLEPQTYGVSLKQSATLRAGRHVLDVGAGELTLWELEAPAGLASTAMEPATLEWPGVPALLLDMDCAPWLAERVRVKAESASGLDRIAAGGELLRLWSPQRAQDRQAVFEQALQGQSARTERTREWARTLPERESWLSHACDRAFSLEQELTETLERWEPQAAELLSGLLQERDRLESVCAVFALLGEQQPLVRQLHELDGQVGTHNSRLGELLADQRVSDWSLAVSVADARSWWGAP